MEKGFEFLPHTADVRLRVRGKTVKELFANALAGVAFYLAPNADPSVRGGAKVTQTVRAEAPDLNSLLIEFLSQIIAQSDIHDAVFHIITFKEFGENFMEGEIAGVKTHGFEKDIKAISYHEVDIKRNPESGLFETVLVLDI